MPFQKKTLKAPDSWPLAARELYSEFARRLERFRSARHRLLLLDHFFVYQEQQKLTYRDVGLAVVDAFLDTLPLRRRPNYLAPLRHWLRFLYKHQELLLPLHEELQSPGRFKYRRRTLLTYDQVVQVLNLTETNRIRLQALRDRAYLEMAYATGMRRGELSALDLTDVDLADGLVHIGRSKNGYARKVPLTRCASHYLKIYLRDARPKMTSPHSSNALWLTRQGNRIRNDAVSQALHGTYRAKEKLGFNCTLHHLRHACATHLLTSGAPLMAVKELLGHLALSSTQIYTHMTPTHLQQVHRSCHPRNQPDFGKESSDY